MINISICIIDLWKTIRHYTIIRINPICIFIAYTYIYTIISRNMLWSLIIASFQLRWLIYNYNNNYHLFKLYELYMFIVTAYIYRIRILENWLIDSLKITLQLYFTSKPLYITQCIWYPVYRNFSTSLLD